MASTTKIRKTLGVNVKAARKRAKLTQVRLAQRAKMDPTYITHIESGRRNVTLDIVEKLAKVLGTKPYTLLRE